MQLAKFELKKIFIKQYGLIFFTIFIVLKIISLFLFDKPINQEMHLERHSYNYYLRQLEGKLTEEKKKFFIKEQNRIIEANSSLQILNNAYYNGKIDKIEYEEKLNKLKKILDNEKGFDIIYNQFIYSIENPDQRYIMSTNGWEGLMTNMHMDWLFILLILLLITPIFCEEFVSEMNITIHTQIYGGRYSAICKIIISIIIAIFLSIINSTIEYVFFFNKYGLENGNFPLQSLKFFSNSNKEINIICTYLGIVLLKILGTIYLTILILFLSVLARRYAFVLLISTSTLLLPYSIFNLQSTKYRIPVSPLGFLLSTGYYIGDKYQLDPLTREKIMIFREISNTERIIIILIVLAIILGMIITIVLKNTNILYKSRMRAKLKG